MIRNSRVKTLPQELVTQAGPHYIQSPREERYYQSLLAVSIDNRYYTWETESQGSLPLFLVGAFKPGNFADYCELWMIASAFLSRYNQEYPLKVWAPRALEMWAQDVPEKVIARCDSRKTAAFLRWLGLKQLAPGLYEVK